MLRELKKGGSARVLYQFDLFCSEIRLMHYDRVGESVTKTIYAQKN